MLKINVDASWKNNGCCGAIGVVMRDSVGRCLAVRRKEISAPTVVAGEALAVLERCMLAKQENLSHVVVESDCTYYLLLGEQFRQCILGGVSHFVLGNGNWQYITHMYRVLDPKNRE